MLYHHHQILFHSLMDQHQHQVNVLNVQNIVQPVPHIIHVHNVIQISNQVPMLLILIVLVNHLIF